MLPKKNRVTKKDVDLLFKQSKFVNSLHLTFKYLILKTKEDTRSKKISFITPKSITKIAVKRNLLRRKGYRILIKYIDQFPAAIIGVFIFRKYEEDISKIESDIQNILGKIN